MTRNHLLAALGLEELLVFFSSFLLKSVSSRDKEKKPWEYDVIHVINVWRLRRDR
jgi:hypothetical protein